MSVSLIDSGNSSYTNRLKRKIEQEANDRYSFTREDLDGECKLHFKQLRDRGEHDACIQFVEQILIDETMSSGVKASLLSMKASAHIKRNMTDDYSEAVIALQTGLESSRISTADRATLYTRLGLVWLDMTTISNHLDFAIKNFRLGIELKGIPYTYSQELLKLNEYAFNLKIQQIHKMFFSLMPIRNQINLPDKIKLIKVLTPVGELTFTV